MPRHIPENLDKIMRKVQNLLDLSSNNPSAEEATAAALKAQELIAKYNLEMSEMEDEPFDYINQSSFYTGIDRSWKYSLAHTVSDNFRVKHYWKGRVEVCFFGYTRDTAVAVRVYEFLFKVCEKNARRVCRESYKSRGTEKGVYYSYTRGFLTGIRMELDKQCTALMIVIPEEVTEDFDQFSKNEGMSTMSTRHTAGMTDNWHNATFHNGVSDGRNAIHSSAIEDKSGDK